MQLREFAKTLQEMVVAEMDEEKIRLKTEEFMEIIYRIVGICLGIPPKSFTWEYYDKSKQHCIQENLTSLQFYENLVKPLYNVEDKVSHSTSHIFSFIFSHNIPPIEFEQ